MRTKLLPEMRATKSPPSFKKRPNSSVCITQAVLKIKPSSSLDQACELELGLWATIFFLCSYCWPSEQFWCASFPFVYATYSQKHFIRILRFHSYTVSFGQGWQFFRRPGLSPLAISIPPVLFTSFELRNNTIDQYSFFAFSNPAAIRVFISASYA